VVSETGVGMVILRLLDIVLALFGILITFPLIIVIFMVGLFDTGSPIFLQSRVGRCQRPFTLVKFRTMKTDTESVATHLANPATVTKVGSILRHTKLDELPQLWNVIKGEMSLVGPRPCLFNQDELIRERAARSVFNVRPGITGLAQVQGIDMSTPRLLAETDARMIESMSVSAYFRYILRTITGSGSGDRIQGR